MDPKEKTPAVDAAEATKAYDGGRLKQGQQYSANGSGSKAQSAAERLFESFHSDAKKHVEISGFKGIRKDGKHEFSKTLTVPTPLTIEHVQAHLDGKLRVAAVPLLENDTAKFGCIDIDLYNGSLDPDLNEHIPALPPSTVFQLLQICWRACMALLRRASGGEYFKKDSPNSQQGPWPAKEGCRILSQTRHNSIG